VGDKPRLWPKWLCWAELWFSTNFNVSAGMVPFKALYGREPSPILKGPTIPSIVEAVNMLYHERDVILDQLPKNLTVAQERMKKQTDKHRRELVLTVGEWVYLKAKPYRWSPLPKVLWCLLLTKWWNRLALLPLNWHYLRDAECIQCSMLAN